VREWVAESGDLDLRLFRGENHRKLTLPKNPHAENNGDGYTNLEN
jgi:hypothetical protein